MGGCILFSCVFVNVDSIGLRVFFSYGVNSNVKTEGCQLFVLISVFFKGEM